MTTAVLALQGAFIEHEHMLQRLGEPCFEIRKAADLDREFDRLILPGGESTVMGKLLHELGLFGELKRRIADGLPVLGTCAGLILLASKLENDDKVWFGTMPVTVRRNAYGRQLGSFHTAAEFKGLGRIPMTFIRAPIITSVSDRAEVMAEVDSKIVAARYGRQLALTFHPELDDDPRIHEMFLRL